jgi:hypothetical protein
MLMDAAPAQLTATDVLSHVFRKSLATKPHDQIEERPVHVITQGAEPRWIVIGKPSSVQPVLKSWAPWKPISRLQWKIVRLAAATNGISMLPGVSKSSAIIDTSYWRASLPEFPDQWSAVIHVGNQSHTRKAILFLVDSGARVVSAAKIPLVPDAVQAIFREADALDLLSRFAYLPRVLFRDRLLGVAAQSWLEGKPVGRGFTEAHLDLLRSLACAEGTIRVCDCRDELTRNLQDVDLPFDRSMLARAMDMLDCDTTLPRFVEHRDFAPWNLKWISKARLGLLDWEWAEAEGLPWQDASRFFYIDDVHFNGSGMVWEALMQNLLLKRYRREFDIPDSTLPALTMRYLLRELLMEFEGGNQWLAKYAFKQICALVARFSKSKG